ncbi:hypothetical protein GCM10011369_18210 [Neiella marina]|uniref:Uncharacterized protein n=1 Tax=Neiella marina TaxID=508461 RepID=A0A8J2U527_9GAMM|nr:hypothetical protein [Neiella marina]GGA76674.1 hypothetical protein GCM10011369_18210 [Neiella marina]
MTSFKLFRNVGFAVACVSLLSMPALADEQKIQDCRIVATYIDQHIPQFAQQEDSDSKPELAAGAQVAFADKAKNQRFQELTREVIAMTATTGIAESHWWNAVYQKKCADDLLVVSRG